MDASKTPGINAVSLRNAVFCADCEVISDSPHETCQVCGSPSLLSISRILGGTLPEERAHLVESPEPKTERLILMTRRRTQQRRSKRAVA